MKKNKITLSKAGATSFCVRLANSEIKELIKISEHELEDNIQALIKKLVRQKIREYREAENEN